MHVRINFCLMAGLPCSSTPSPTALHLTRGIKGDCALQNETHLYCGGCAHVALRLKKEPSTDNFTHFCFTRSFLPFLTFIFLTRQRLVLITLGQNSMYFLCFCFQIIVGRRSIISGTNICKISGCVFDAETQITKAHQCTLAKVS